MPADPVDYVPPVVRLILDTPLPKTSELGGLVKYLKSLRKDASPQADWTEGKFEYFDDANRHQVPGLIVSASAGLDPFSTFGKCAALPCRVANAEQIARSIGIYADVILTRDCFTPAFFPGERWTQAKSIWMLNNIIVLRVLRPLVESGILRFVRPYYGLCEQHYGEFTARVEAVVQTMLSDPSIAPTFVRRGNDEIILHSRLQGFSLLHTVHLPSRARNRLTNGVALDRVGREIYAPILAGEVSETMWALLRASNFGGVTFSNSRAAMISAATLDGELPSLANLELWEANRSASLPWVRDLSVSEVLQLRESAAMALPRFRVTMANALSVSGAVDAESVRHTVLELRAEAEEVGAELAALNLGRGKKFRGVAGLLSLTASVYGFGAGLVAGPIAAGGLLTALGLIHSSARKDEQEHAKMKIASRLRVSEGKRAITAPPARTPSTVIV